MTQERKTASVVLSPDAKRARIVDLNNKMKCWAGHIIIAQAMGDSRQTRIGEARLRELREQIGTRIGDCPQKY